MDPGKPFTVRIEHHGVPVWQREFLTARKRRKLPFDFPIKAIVDAEQARLNAGPALCEFAHGVQRGDPAGGRGIRMTTTSAPCA